MTLDETIDLLTAAAAFDRRTVGKADALAWHAAVGDLRFADAHDAVIAHYAGSTEWLMPAHVRQRVQEVRMARHAAVEVPAPPRETLDDPAAYHASLHAARIAIGDGMDPVAASRQAAARALERRAPLALEGP